VGKRNALTSAVPYTKPTVRQADPEDHAYLGSLLLERAAVWHAGRHGDIGHSCYSLLGCPPLPKANFILARFDDNGLRTVLRIGRVEHRAASLNLAVIRQIGASLGANEVHIHVPTGGLRARCRIERQLKFAAATDEIGCTMA